MTSERAVLFDFDFTLGDSSQAIVACFLHAFAQLHLPAPARDDIAATIGISLTDAFFRLTGTADSRLAADFVTLYHAHADKVMDANTRIYATARPMVERLRAADIRTGIVSTKLRARIDSILRLNQLREFFDVIVGSDDVDRLKPDPEGLLLATRRLGVPPRRSLYIGDHVVDAEAAQRAGIAFIAVLTGKHTRIDFGPLPVQAVVGDISDLLDACLSERSMTTAQTAQGTRNEDCDS